MRAGWLKHCESFKILNGMHHLPKLEDFDVETIYYRVFFFNWSDTNPANVACCNGMHYSGLVLLKHCPGLVLILSGTNPGFTTHALTQPATS